MEVIFTAPVKIGNRNYKKTEKGKTENVPVSLAYNRGFHKLVQTGVVKLVPLDAAKQKIRHAHDAKAFAAAKAKRKATLAAKAAKASQSAQGASIASSPSSSASGPAQALPTPAKPSGAVVAQKAVPATTANAKGE